MKKSILSVVALATFTMTSFAQQEDLKAAASNIEEKDYIAALDNLTKAKKKVNELITDQLASVLPAALGEFEMAEAEGMDMMGEGQGVSVYKTYKIPEPKNDEVDGTEEDTMDMSMDMGNKPQLTVQITTNMMMANEVMNAHSMSEGMSGGDDAEAYRVKGFRALSKSYGGESGGQEGEVAGMMQQPKMEEAHVIVGGAFVMVTAQGLEKDGQAKAFLELVDFEKLISLVGK